MLRADLADTEQALATTRRALIDLMGFFDRVAASQGDWSVPDVRRIAEIRRMVHVAANILETSK